MISLIEIYNNLLSDFVHNLLPAFQQGTNTNVTKNELLRKVLPFPCLGGFPSEDRLALW